MTKNVKVLLTLLSAVFFCTFLPGSARATTLSVNCNGSAGEDQLTTIGGALKLLNPEGPNTLNVSGSCHENIVIQGFGRLTLIAVNGASITDASGGTANVVSITDSLRVSLQGFTIIGSGPSNEQNNGIHCIASNCSFSGNTVQGVSDGVQVFQGARASFNGDIIQNNGGRGVAVNASAFALADGVTIQSNANSGVAVDNGATLLISNSTVQNNSLAGIVVRGNGTAVVSQTTITGNANNGIDVNDHSTLLVGRGFGADLIGNSITGNRGVGIRVRDLSFARFGGGVPNVVKNNVGQPDVWCTPQFSATRGVAAVVAGGGTTNCVEP